jgi:hypothetical protein
MKIKKGNKLVSFENLISKRHMRVGSFRLNVQLLGVFVINGAVVLDNGLRWDS